MCLIRLHDVDAWAVAFLKAMNSSMLGTIIPVQMMEEKLEGLQLTMPEDFDGFLARYISDAEKLAILLDYDGTLAPIAPHPDMAIIPNETQRVLERLSNCPDVYVAIISGKRFFK